jgi:hypothetical protein
LGRPIEAVLDLDVWSGASWREERPVVRAGRKWPLDPVIRGQRRQVAPQTRIDAMTVGAFARSAIDVGGPWQAIVPAAAAAVLVLLPLGHAGI